MASELRVNTINSRTGFGTITVSETGQDLVGITTIENLTTENTLVGAAASFTGNVQIGGVLTYEDVTNIDSVGLITARSGIEIGARPGVGASISADGNMIVSGISTLNSLKCTKSGQSDLLIGSTNAGGAYLLLDGDSNGDAIGADYSYIGHDTGGDLLLGADNPSGDADIIFKAGNNAQKATITALGKVGISTGTIDPDGNQLLIRAASTVGTTKGHIMLTGDSATVGQGPQIVFSESGGGSSYAGAYIGHAREGSNSVGTLVFGTRATGGDANTVPTERLSIGSDGTVTIASEDLVFGTTGKGIEFPNSASIKQNLSNLYLNLASGNNNVEVQSNGTSFVKFRGTNGDVELVDGNIVMSTAGKGIDFSATSGSGTSELFEDYEEGTWTGSVSYTGSNSGLNVTEGNGKYIKIGHQVHCTLLLSWDEGSASGNVTMTGLPFSIANDSHVRLGGHAIYMDGFSGLSGSNIFLYNTGNSTSALMYFVSGDNDSHLGPSDSAVTHSQTSSNNTTRWVLTYQSA